MRLTTLQKNISKATIAIAKATDALTKRAKDRKEVTNNHRNKVIVRNLTDKSFVSRQCLTKKKKKKIAQRRDSQNPPLPYNVSGNAEMSAGGFKWLYGEDVKKRRNRDS